MSTTTNLKLPEIAVGQSQKETTHNAALTILDKVLGTKLDIAVTAADVTLTDSQHDGAVYFKFTDTMTAPRAVIFQGRGKLAMVEHAAAGSHNITLKSGSGAGATVTLAPGDIKMIYVDGANNAVIKPT